METKQTIKIQCFEVNHEKKEATPFDIEYEYEMSDEIIDMINEEIEAGANAAVGVISEERAEDRRIAEISRMCGMSYRKYWKECFA